MQKKYIKSFYSINNKTKSMHERERERERESLPRGICAAQRSNYIHRGESKKIFLRIFFNFTGKLNKTADLIKYRIVLNPQSKLRCFVLSNGVRVVLTSLIAAMACTGIIYAATTVGTNISTTGTLITSNTNTLYGATTIGGDLTATSTLTVEGLTTLGNASTTLLSISGNLFLNTASSTGIVKFSQINSDTGSIDFGDENLTTTGDLSVANATITGALNVSGNTTLATTTISGNLEIAKNFYAKYRDNPPKTLISGFDTADEWTVANEASTEDVVNGGFELAGGSWSGCSGTCPPDFQYSSGAPVLTLETSIVSAGSQSIKVVTDANHEGIQTYNTGASSFTKGEHYTVSVDIYSDSTDAAKIYAQINCNTTNENNTQLIGTCADVQGISQTAYISRESCVQAGHIWTRASNTGQYLTHDQWITYSAEIVAQEDDSVCKFSVRAGTGDNTGTFYVDNVSVQKSSNIGTYTKPVNTTSASRNISPVGGDFFWSAENAGNSAVTISKTFNNLDLSKHHFDFWVYANNRAGFENANPTLSVNDGSTTGVASIMMIKDNDGWHHISITRDAFANHASIDWSSTTNKTLTFTFTPDTGETFQIALDELFAYETFPIPFIIYASDDCVGTDYTFVAPYFSQYGQHMVSACQTDNIVEFNGSGDKLTMADLQKLDQAGHDVISHSHNHIDFADENIATQRYEFLKPRKVLNSLGIFSGARFMAFPYGSIDNMDFDTMNEVKKHYLLALATDGYEASNSIPLSDPYRIKRFDINNVTTSELTNMLNNLTIYGGLLVTYSHTIDTDVERENVRHLADTANSLGIPIVTLSMLYDNFLPGIQRNEDGIEQFELITPLSADITLHESDAGTIECTAGATDRTATLPTLADSFGLEFTMKKLDSGVGDCIFNGEGAETIDGVASTSASIDTQYEYMIIRGGTAEWNIVGGNY